MVRSGGLDGTAVRIVIGIKDMTARRCVWYGNYLLQLSICRLKNVFFMHDNALEVISET